MAILVDRNSKVVIQGITGRETFMVTKLMLDYGTPVIAGVTPGRGGQEVEGVPVFDTLCNACRAHVAEEFDGVIPLLQKALG